MKKVHATFIFGAALAVALVGCGGKRIAVPMASDTCVGMNYADVQQAFNDSGFANIVLVPVDGFAKYHEDGAVKSVEIGQTIVCTGWEDDSTFPEDDTIRITYYVVDDPAPTATPEPTPTQAPTDDAASAAPVYEEYPDSDNWLLRPRVIVYPLWNGNNTKVVAYRGVVQFDKEMMEAHITSDDYEEFLELRFEDHRLNWLTIDFLDGTGIWISSGLYDAYGPLEENGTVQDAVGYMEITKDGWIYSAQ